MARITFPFYSSSRQIQLKQWGTVELQAFQILVYVSISEQGLLKPKADPVIPALLDTGNSHCFTLNEFQLEAALPWGMPRSFTGRTYNIKSFGGTMHTARALRGDIWLHDGQDFGTVAHLNAGSPGVNHCKLSLAHEGIACVRIDFDDPRKEHGWSPNLVTRFWELVTRPKFDVRKPPAELTAPLEMAGRLRDRTTARLSLPHLPLLGLRALCLNSLRIELLCTPDGGTLIIDPPTLRSPDHVP